jgi:molybdopterin-guanine dinucleotide biosynthesis protein A
MVASGARAGIAAAILAGGRARRLGGAHKGLLRVGGEPIVARQLRALAPLVGERLIVANDPDAYAGFGVRVIPDLHPDRGPLAGLEAALLATDAATLVVLACDLPFADPGPLVAAPPAPLVVARAGDVVQPLVGRYARALLPEVQARLAAGRLRLFDLVDAVGAQLVDVDAHTLTNVNTAEELAAAERFCATCS